jgi:hypothetical protein
MVDAGAQVTCGIPGAASGREEGAGSMGPRRGLGATTSREAGAGDVGTRRGPGAAPSREAGAVVFT